MAKTLPEYWEPSYGTTIAIIEDDEQALEVFRKEADARYFMKAIVLTPEHIEALKNGKIIAISSGGEFVMVRFAEQDKDNG